MKNRNLTGYASNFVSFLLSSEKFPASIKSIILFGSVARGDFHRESDIDIFIDTNTDIPKTKKVVEILLEEFYGSKFCKVWNTLGVRNQIRVLVGDLEKSELKHSIISDGITLYSKFKAGMEGGPYLLCSYSPIKDSRKRMGIERKLFGYRAKGKRFNGIVDDFGGEKVSSRSFLVPLEAGRQIEPLFKKHRIALRRWMVQVSK